MMELVDMPGMSAQFRICRMRTANFKKVGGTLMGPFCAPNLKFGFDDLFCMRGAPLRKKSARWWMVDEGWWMVRRGGLVCVTGADF